MYDELVKRLRSECGLPYYSAVKDMREAADAIEELICEVADEHNRRVDAEERQRWIPVTERLPEEDTDVLVVRKFLGVKRQAPSDWRSCDNCGDRKCYGYMQTNPELDLTVPCDDWQKFPCLFCGGALSEKRYHNGKAYRHCYACHAEFYIGEEKQ